MEKYELFPLQSKDCDVLSWWKQHMNVLPLLAKIAKRDFTIPALSAKSECVFSTSGRVTAIRKRLALKKVESLVLIKENKAKVDSFKLNSDYVLDKTERNAFENISKLKTNASQSEVFTTSDKRIYY